MPNLQYPNGYDIDVEGGTAVHDIDGQSVLVRADGIGKVGVTITRK